MRGLEVLTPVLKENNERSSSEGHRTQYRETTWRVASTAFLLHHSLDHWYQVAVVTWL